MYINPDIKYFIRFKFSHFYPKIYKKNVFLLISDMSRNRLFFKFTNSFRDQSLKDCVLFSIGEFITKEQFNVFVKNDSKVLFVN